MLLFQAEEGREMGKGSDTVKLTGVRTDTSRVLISRRKRRSLAGQSNISLLT